MAKGWFKIDGVQQGERSLQQQMRGLHHALSLAKGKRVLDLGCAEGLIAIEFAKVGADVCGVEAQPAMVEIAKRLAAEAKVEARFYVEDLNEAAKYEESELDKMRADHGPDITLALAILHKLHNPLSMLRLCAAATRELLIIRLPIRSSGKLVSKIYPERACDTRTVLPGMGYKLKREELGPRDEIVQYWLRRK